METDTIRAAESLCRAVLKIRGALKILSLIYRHFCPASDKFETRAIMHSIGREISREGREIKNGRWVSNEIPR